MQAVSERLIVEPLSPDFFAGLNGVDAATREAMNELYASRPAGAEFFWYAYWRISRMSDGEHVGGLCFMGEPIGGAVEIGYGLLPGMEKHGYMTEAVLCMCRWLAEHGVQTLRAGCEADNPASAAVLGRCGFSACGEEAGVLWFEKKLKKEIG